MKEREVERHLVEAVRQLGGRALKFQSPGMDGVPDRLVLMPVPAEDRLVVGRYVRFVEVKRPGEKPRPLQAWVIEELQRMGHCAGWVSSRDEIARMFR